LIVTWMGEAGRNIRAVFATGGSVRYPALHRS
jgi:hypothetical protein